MGERKLVCKKSHFDRPIPDTYHNCYQFKKYSGNFLVSESKQDSYFEISGTIIAEKNILVNPSNEVLVVYQKYCSMASFFDYPLDSAFLGIYVVGDLEKQLHVASVILLTRKHKLISIDQHYVAMPLVHNNYGKYL